MSESDGTSTGGAIATDPAHGSAAQGQSTTSTTTPSPGPLPAPSQAPAATITVTSGPPPAPLVSSSAPPRTSVTVPSSALGAIATSGPPARSSSAPSGSRSTSVVPSAERPRSSTGRNAYAELLRDTRGMRREQQQARDQWFAKLAADKKEESLFELEILLKGLACFANPRNHPGAGRRQTIVSLDFKEHVAHVREGMTRVTQLSRTMLGDRDRAFVFQRYLETVLPEDTARTRLLRASMAQETPEGSLFMLRHGFTNLIEVTNGLLRLSRVNFRLFYAALATTMREITQSAFFNPLAALEFRPEFDRIPSPQVLELIQSIPG